MLEDIIRENLGYGDVMIRRCLLDHREGSRKWIELFAADDSYSRLIFLAQKKVASKNTPLLTS